jgi:hypothetical protein
MIRLKKNNTYLVERKHTFSNNIDCITVLEITKKAYQIKWNSQNNPITWEFKKVFDKDYALVENITTKIADPNASATYTAKINVVEKVSTRYKQCPICHGMGTVPDNKSTAGTAMCPLCQGNKQVVDTVEIVQ